LEEKIFRVVFSAHRQELSAQAVAARRQPSVVPPGALLMLGHLGASRLTVSCAGLRPAQPPWRLPAGRLPCCPAPCSAASAPSLLLLSPVGRRRPPPASCAVVPGYRPPAHPALWALRRSGLPARLSTVAPPASLPPCSARWCLPPSLPPWLPTSLLGCSLLLLPPASVLGCSMPTCCAGRYCSAAAVHPPPGPVCRSAGCQPPCPPGQWRLPAQPAPLLPWL
jgi:hypothetical protein